MKIVYCINSTEPTYGGTEVVTVMKANALSMMEGYDVWILVTDQLANSSRTVSEKVHVVDLNIDYYDDNTLWKIFKSYTIKRWRHQRILQQWMDKIEPDVVISTSQMEKYMIPRLMFKTRPYLIRELHFCSSFRLINAKTWWKRLFAKITNWYDYQLMIGKYDKLVVLTKEDKEKTWPGNERVIVIPNPLQSCGDAPVSQSSRNIRIRPSHVAVAIGRLVSQKNFASAIRIWKKVVDRHHDWVLQIWGEGGQRRMLQRMIDELSLADNVQLMGYSSDVINIVSEARFLVFTSDYEGFGMVIVEGMSVGLPAISYTCPCGPKDIITDGVDGFLIAVGDEEMMAKKICQLIENPDLLEKMSIAAMQKASVYSIDRVMQQWVSLFEHNVGRKKM